MRVRLLMDVELNAKDIENLQKAMEFQPGGTIRIDGFRTLGARLMGAIPVEVETPRSPDGNS